MSSLVRCIRTQAQHHAINLRVSEAILAGREGEVLGEIRAAILNDSTEPSWVRNLKGAACAARLDYFGDLKMAVFKNRPWAAFYGRQLAVLEGREVATPEEVLWLRAEEDRCAKDLEWATGLTAEHDASIAAVGRKVMAYRDLAELGKLAEQLPRMRARRNEVRQIVAETTADLAAIRAAIKRAEEVAA